MLNEGDIHTLTFAHTVAIAHLDSNGISVCEREREKRERVREKSYRSME